MPLDKIFAQLSCANLVKSEKWFSTLFGRKPDANPMDGLLEWHHGGSAGFQLFKDTEKAGSGTLTLIVSELADERIRLGDAGMNPPAIQPADATNLLQLQDPDGNSIVLVQPVRT